MGNNDLIGLVGIVVVAGLAYVFLSSDTFKNLGAGNNSTSPGFVSGDTGSSGDTTGTKSNTSSDCKAIYNGSCKSECAGGCGSSKCKDCLDACNEDCSSGLVGGSSQDINCNDGTTCGQRCAKGWCNSYRGCGCKLAGGCATCGQGGSGGSTNCPDLCRRRECSTYKKLCGSSGCTQCNCSHLCSTAQCSTLKSQCGTSTFNSCSNCHKPSNSGSGVSTPSTTKGGNCCQGNKCTNAKTAADCCRWRGDNGGCGSNQLGVPGGGGCNCIKDPYAGRAKLNTRAFHTRPNIRTSYRLSIA